MGVDDGGGAGAGCGGVGGGVDGCTIEGGTVAGATGAGGVTHDGGLTWEPAIVVPFRDGIFNLSDIAVVDAGAR